MKFYVTTPIYYVNAKPHVGHLYTAVAADVLARWHRGSGEEVVFSTGTDENSQKNVEAAQAAGQRVKDYVDEMAGIWEQTWRQLGLSYDVFIRTTAPTHKQAVAAMLKSIAERGDVYLGDYEGYYCTGCEAFWTAKELVEGKCPIHHTRPQLIKEKNYFFRMRAYRDQLLAHYQANPDWVQPVAARNHVLAYIEHELDDISISRQAQAWGIRLPQDPTHAVYVWFDALINYLTVAGYSNDQEKFAKFWPPDLHLIGKDIVKFHAVIWPAMLLAAGLPLPKKIFAHGFFTVDGEKISKSLGNAIDPLAITQEYPVDALRYYLLREIPFGADGDFSLARLQERYNADLANGLGNLVSRVLNMIQQYWPQFAPPYEGGKAPQGGGGFLADVDKYLNNLAFDKALEAIWQAIRAADELIEQKKPWQLAKEGKQKKLQDVLAQLYATLVAINEKIAPFMPATHEKLAEHLAARPIKKPSEPLFLRKV